MHGLALLAMHGLWAPAGPIPTNPKAPTAEGGAGRGGRGPHAKQPPRARMRPGEKKTAKRLHVDRGGERCLRLEKRGS